MSLTTAKVTPTEGIDGLTDLVDQNYQLVIKLTDFVMNVGELEGLIEGCDNVNAIASRLAESLTLFEGLLDYYFAVVILVKYPAVGTGLSHFIEDDQKPLLVVDFDHKLSPECTLLIDHKLAKRDLENPQKLMLTELGVKALHLHLNPEKVALIGDEIKRGRY